MDYSQSTQCSAYSEESDSAQRAKSGGLDHANHVLAVLSNERMSPLRSQLQKHWEDVADRTKRYYKRKAEEGINHVLEIIAPGQTKELKISKFAVETDAQSDKDLLSTIIKMIDNTDNNALKIQLLGLLTLQYSNPELQKLMPDLTSYKFYKAKKLNIAATGMSLKPKENLPREKLDKVKLQHALSFFMDPSLIQSVSYGTRELKLDSGEVLTIPDVVRTVCHSQIINLYSSYCSENNFEPLGKSTLFKLLNACAAAKRTSLQGLDNIAADGNEAFKTLVDIADALYDQNEISKDHLENLKEKLSKVKQYLKTSYKFHCIFHDTCSDHCITWLLSDPLKEQFQMSCDHIHSTTCDQCEQLRELEAELLQCTSSKLPWIADSVPQEIEHIHNWKKHIVRTINQDQSKLNILQGLQSHQDLIIMDWAMKFLPRKV